MNICLTVALIITLGGSLSEAAGTALKNEDKDCWGGCNAQQGPCAWCGNGLCCRRGWGDTSKGCNGSIGGDNHHVCVSADGVRHSGEDCWGGCNKHQGACEWCGTGLCCRQGWSDISNGCDSVIGGPGYHACVAPGGLVNSGKDCWGGCNTKQGPCDWCGTGLCCRAGWWDTSNGCNGLIGGDNYHACVEAPAPAPAPAPVPADPCAGLQDAGIPSDVNGKCPNYPDCASVAHACNYTWGTCSPTQGSAAIRDSCQLTCCKND